MLRLRAIDRDNSKQDMWRFAQQDRSKRGVAKTEAAAEQIPQTLRSTRKLTAEGAGNHKKHGEKVAVHVQLRGAFLKDR